MRAGKYERKFPAPVPEPIDAERLMQVPNYASRAHKVPD